MFDWRFSENIEALMGHLDLAMTSLDESRRKWPDNFYFKTQTESRNHSSEAVLKDNLYTLEIDMPGVKPNAILIEYSPDTSVVTVKSSRNDKNRSVKYQFPKDASVSGASAVLLDGVLTIQVPRKIKIDNTINIPVTVG